ncbi:MAG: hypothetical protein LH468_05400 [Nocardioides sp.]|nr:hypothetical protein [Nocardioides sp.]
MYAPSRLPAPARFVAATFPYGARNDTGARHADLKARVKHLPWRDSLTTYADKNSGSSVP